MSAMTAMTAMTAGNHIKFDPGILKRIGRDVL